MLFSRIMRKYKLSLGKRIYISMLLLLLVSFVITGLSTALQFNSQNTQYHADRLKRQERAVMSSIDYFLEQEDTRQNPDSIVRLFNDKICELADINKLDINMYNLRGELLISSYSDFVDSTVFKFQLGQSLMDSLVLSEHVVRTLSYEGSAVTSTYTYIHSNAGVPLAIVNIPYFRPDNLNKQELTAYLITLSEIYLILFVGASVLAYFLSKYITGSLKKIRDKLTQTQITQQNEPLEWAGNDEIGMIVSAYNSMLQQLQESARQLAQSERESAWREMAKQVAHEIKNPLTPMKLSVQHLQRTLGPEDENFEERLNRFAQTLVEQIDTLSAIASEFSDFAKMPKASNEAVNIAAVLESAVDLYKEESGATIELKNEIGSQPTVFADAKQLGRCFQNLIKNSLQAIPDDRNGHICVTLANGNREIRVAIQDNGTGIPEHMRDKIFEPNFTTKSSGMGLGLAMVRGMIENANGHIAFETEEGKGTTFTVTLPQHS